MMVEAPQIKVGSSALMLLIAPKAVSLHSKKNTGLQMVCQLSDLHSGNILARLA